MDRQDRLWSWRPSHSMKVKCQGHNPNPEAHYAADNDKPASR